MGGFCYYKFLLILLSLTSTINGSIFSISPLKITNRLIHNQKLQHEVTKYGAESVLKKLAMELLEEINNPIRASAKFYKNLCDIEPDQVNEKDLIIEVLNCTSSVVENLRGNFETIFDHVNITTYEEELKTTFHQMIGDPINPTDELIELQNSPILSEELEYFLQYVVFPVICEGTQSMLKCLNPADIQTLKPCLAQNSTIVINISMKYMELSNEALCADNGESLIKLYDSGFYHCHKEYDLHYRKCMMNNKDHFKLSNFKGYENAEEYCSELKVWHGCVYNIDSMNETCGAEAIDTFKDTFSSLEDFIERKCSISNPIPSTLTKTNSRTGRHTSTSNGTNPKGYGSNTHLFSTLMGITIVALMIMTLKV